MKKMKAALIDKAFSLKTVELDIPVPKDNEVLIEVHASGICGTDLHIFQGDYKGSYPITPGHEIAGIITACGAGITRFKPGDRVSMEPNLSCGICYDCLSNRQHFCEKIEAVGVTRAGGMAQYVAVPEGAVFPIGDLSYEEGAFMEPLSCVLHGVEQLAPHLADRVLLMGAGPIGLLLLQNLRVKGCSHVHVMDRDESRLEKALALGAASVSTSLEPLPKESFHIVCDATGAEALLESSLNYVRPSGKILWFAVPHKDSIVKIPPFRMFEKEISIFSSYTSCRNSWQALSLIQSGQIQVKDLVSHKLPLGEFKKGLRILETHSEPAMKILVMPQDCGN